MFKEPHRNIEPALIQEVREHLLEMIEIGEIRASSSPYSSNVVILRKQEGTIRFCIDYRNLKSRIFRYVHAMIPMISYTLRLFAGAKYFSKLNLKCGFWQVKFN